MNDHLKSSERGRGKRKEVIGYNVRGKRVTTSSKAVGLHPVV